MRSAMKKTPTFEDVRKVVKALKEKERLTLKINAYKFPIINFPLFEKLKAAGKIYEVHKGVWELTQDKYAAELEDL